MKIRYWMLGCLSFAFVLMSFMDWNSAEMRTRRLRAKSSNSGTQNGECLNCIKMSDTISIELTNNFEEGFPCEIRQIELTQIVLKDQYGQICEQAISSENIKIPYFKQGISFKFNNPPLTPPFSLTQGNTAFIEIPINCPELVYNGSQGELFLQYCYLSCEGDTIVNSDLLKYDIGCPDVMERGIIYKNNATLPNDNELLLPYYSFAEILIRAEGQVKVAKNTAAIFRVCPKGRVKVIKDRSTKQGGVKVEKGAFFKAERVPVIE